MNHKRRFRHLLNSGFLPMRPSFHFVQTVKDSATEDESVTEDSLVCVLEKFGVNIAPISEMDLNWDGSVQMDGD